MAFCLPNFHIIIYNTPPLILNFELDIELPCSEAQWRSLTADGWKGARTNLIENQISKYLSQARFPQLMVYLRKALHRHALIQNTFFLRQTISHQPVSERSLSTLDMLAVEKALESWIEEWERVRNPRWTQKMHVALLLQTRPPCHVLPIRFAVDVGSWRAIRVDDPVTMAGAISQSLQIVRSPFFDAGCSTPRLCLEHPRNAWHQCS